MTPEEILAAGREIGRQEFEALRADAERYRALRGWVEAYGRVVLGRADGLDPGDSHWDISFGRVQTRGGYLSLEAAIDAQRARE